MSAFRRFLHAVGLAFGSVQRYDLGVRAVDPATGLLRLRTGRYRAVLMVPACADEDVRPALARIAAAVNALRVPVTLLGWSEPGGLDAELAQLAARLEADALPANRRALADAQYRHLALVAREGARLPDGRHLAPPRRYGFFLTVDGATPALLERDAARVAADFGAVRLDARTAAAVLAQGWRGTPLPAETITYLSQRDAGPDAPELVIGPQGAKVRVNGKVVAR